MTLWPHLLLETTTAAAATKDLSRSLYCARCSQETFQVFSCDRNEGRVGSEQRASDVGGGGLFPLSISLKSILSLTPLHLQKQNRCCISTKYRNQARGPPPKTLLPFEVFLHQSPTGGAMDPGLSTGGPIITI